MPPRHLATINITTLIVFLLPVASPPAPAADASPKLKTQKVAIRLLEDDGPGPEIELVQIPAGRITLPDAAGKPSEHAIKPLWFARYETRWVEYDVFWQKLDLTVEQGVRLDQQDHGNQRRTTRPYHNPRWWPADNEVDLIPPPETDRCPANCVGFAAAQRYCAWLSKNTGHKFRLPTEAEWQYACRAGGPPLRPEPKALADLAWFADNAKGKTHPVGQKKPNAWGLYDMLGNVGEYLVRDPSDTKGLLAGGSYKDDAKDIHTGAREFYSKDWHGVDPQSPPDPDWFTWGAHHLGFRVVMEE